MPQENQMSASGTAQAQPEAGAELHDHRLNPQGAVPKKSQGYVIAGLAVVILFAVMFSNKHAHTGSHPPTAQTPYATGANQPEIEELKRDLTADQRKMEQQSQAPARSAAETISGTEQFAAAERTGKQPIHHWSCYIQTADSNRRRNVFGQNDIARATSLPARKGN